MPRHWSFEKGNTIVVRQRTEQRRTVPQGRPRRATIKKGPGFPDPFSFNSRLPLLLVLLAAHILLARIFLLLAGLAALLALLLAGLLAGLGLVLPLLLLARLTRRLAGLTRLVALAALVVRHA
jgi:hypothetical protein